MASSAIAHVSSLEAFYELLAKTAPRLLVVDFFAEWCGPCKLVAPKFAELAVKHQRVACFAKVDVDAAQDLAQNAGIRAMPTFQIYKAGERVFELKGADIGKLEAAVLSWSADVGAALEAAEAPPLPHDALLHFDQGHIAKIRAKLLQFDEEQRASDGSGSERLLASLSQPTGPLPGLELCEQLLRCWPAEKHFPVLDQLRLIVLRDEVAEALATEHAAKGSSSLAGRVSAVALTPAAGEVSQMFGLRFWCNLLAHAPAGATALVPAALEAAAQADCHESGRAATRLALSSLLLNAAVLLDRQRAGPDEKTPLVCALQQLLTAPQPDAEVRSRGLLALGTLVHADAATASMCVDLDLSGAVAQLKEDAGATSKGRALAAKVLRLLESKAAAASEVAADAALYG